MGSTPNTRKSQIYGEGAGGGGAVDETLLRGYLQGSGGSPAEHTSQESCGRQASHHLGMVEDEEPDMHGRVSDVADGGLWLN